MLKPKIPQTSFYGSTSMTASCPKTTLLYDGDGNRVKKIENSQTILYVNKYYEKNLSTNTTSSYYYFGGKLVAMKQGSANVTYVHQDHLTGTSVVSDSNGALISSISYSPFGDRLESHGTMPTDRLFTVQRLDGTGLYYYGARYYDPAIGRFISADPIVQNYANPQGFNRYSYVLNNPLKYIDPSGLTVTIGDTDVDELEGVVNSVAWYEMNGTEIPPELLDLLQQLLGGLGEGGLGDYINWQLLSGQEPEYTRHMEKSEIEFNLVDVDPGTKTVTYNADMKGWIDFKEPVQLRFVDKGSTPMFLTMRYVLGNASGVALYPDAIYIRTDFHYNVAYFTNSVAHESFHWWEQSHYGSPDFNWISDWYIRYVTEEARIEHALRPSETRANNYANSHYPRS